MGTIIRISRNSSQQETRKALEKLTKKNRNKRIKSLSDFYGKLPGVYGDGLDYQKKLRDEWQ